MESGKNYIYILFAIGYAIYSIIKAGKKANANRQSTEKQSQETPAVNPPVSSSVPKPGEDMRKMLEDLLGGPRDEKTPEVVLPKPKHKQPVPYHMEHAKIVSHSFDKVKTPVVPEKQVMDKPKIVPQKVAAEPAVEQSAAPDFDIRQAIIFSEILKRPQY
jgi:hypothetical protein